MLGLTQLLSSTRIFKSSSDKSELNHDNDEEHDQRETSKRCEFCCKF